MRGPNPGKSTVRVARLRQKLRQVGVEGPAIRSIRKYGYELIMPAVLTE